MTHDDDLLDALRDVLAGDEPLRPDVADGVHRDAFALRRIDAALADLLYDSGVEPTAGVRGDDEARTVSFAAQGRALDVEIHADASLFGRVSPPDATLSIESPAGQVPLDPDRLGRFTSTAPAHQLRFVIDGATPTPVITPWIFR